jgi:hypothetical protein
MPSPWGGMRAGAAVVLPAPELVDAAVQLGGFCRSLD